VVIAAEDYPGTPAMGDEIDGLEDAERLPGAYVLHAGTRLRADGAVVSSGGRVLDVVGTGADLAEARNAAYRAVAAIRMRGGWYRTDIARRPAAATAAGI
jgi:phosphoribosylamine--glycine ligase